MCALNNAKMIAQLNALIKQAKGGSFSEVYN